ncbi:MAG: MerR family DNA-binding transcriptional regulator [Pseudomonadota bacterium]
MGTQTHTIRQLCDEFSVTPRTLRFYEAKGLLEPIRQGQRRLFTPRDRARLILILRGKRFGFSLSEIKDLLELYDYGDDQVSQLSATLAAAKRHHAELTAKRDELNEAINELEAQMSTVKKLLSEKSADQVAE